MGFLADYISVSWACKGRLGTSALHSCRSIWNQYTASANEAVRTYCMGSIISAGEVDHAINTCESRTVTAVSMGIEFLLGEDVAAALDCGQPSLLCCAVFVRAQPLSQKT